MTNEDLVIDKKFARSEEVTPQDLLRFAKFILSVLAAMFVLSIMCEVFSHDGVVLDACKTILTPLSTLVIGFYFGKSK
jgi:hypothetical protein